jgi:hypothetical protein
MLSLGQNMSQAQQAMQQLYASMESALALAKHAEGWTWKDETSQCITQ